MIRDELKNIIMDKINSKIMSKEYSETLITEYYTSKDVLEKCSIEQLWSLYKLVLKDTPFRILGCDPTDHLAVELHGLFGTMYVGIEVDGYAHS